MLLNYQYRVYPGTNQKLTLNNWLRIARYWYNWQLGDRFDWWERNRSATNSCRLVCHVGYPLRDNPTRYSQQALLPGLKKDLLCVRHSGELLDFSLLPANTLQDVTKRADLAFQRFTSCDLNGNRSGKPRLKNAARYRTLGFTGSQIPKVVRVQKDWLFVTLPRFKGWLKVRYHRPLPDGFEVRTALLTKKADGWYITLCIKDETVPNPAENKVIPAWDNSLGMDAVLHEDDYLATSEGEKLPSLKSFRNNQSKLAKVSEKKSKKRKGSKSRRKLAYREARIHQRVARSRKDHACKTSHALLRTGKKVFFHEKLNLKGLSKRNKAKQDNSGKHLPNGQSAKSGLNKSWQDAAFGEFFKTLQHIAEKAGCKVIPVNPAYTSQILSYKDEFVFTDCSIRKYWDEEYALWIDRDISAGCNIKRVGLNVFPTIKRRSGKVVVDRTTTNSTAKEVLAIFSRCQSPHYNL
ncbi:MAG: transposase [Cyanobacteria bacterium J06639_18]